MKNRVYNSEQYITPARYINTFFFPLSYLLIYTQKKPGRERAKGVISVSAVPTNYLINDNKKAKMFPTVNLVFSLTGTGGNLPTALEG